MIEGSRLSIVRQKLRKSAIRCVRALASSTDVTGHPGSRTDSYIAVGQTSDFSNAVSTAHWYIINAIEVKAEKKACAIVALGNSITDGRGTTTNGQDRWTDNLSRRLLANKATRRVSVLNMGLGGNCIDLSLFEK